VTTNSGSRRKPVRRNKKPKTPVPLSWRVGSCLGSLMIGVAVFALFFFKISRMGSPNPTHPFDPLETAGFGLVFGALGAFLIKIVVVDKILLRTAEKRSAVEIIEEVAKDVAVIGATVAVEGVIDTVTGSSNGGTDDRSGPGSSSPGGGGQFGGGGASGSF
jgi:uncharacterized membrane protein YgcG